MSNYDPIAEWYDTNIRTNTFYHDLIVPALLSLLGDITNQHICDLACGQGIVTRQLANAGAHVVGVDLSTKLLAIAQREEEAAPQGITYLHDDAQTLSSLPDATFDAVTCNMSLIDIPDLNATFRAVHRILRPHGRFAFSITHPCFQTPASHWINASDGTISRAVRSYFVEGFWRSSNPQGVRGQVGAHHRTLSTYLNTLTTAGFSLQHTLEPQLTTLLAHHLPGYTEIPLALLMLATKN